MVICQRVIRRPRGPISSGINLRLWSTPFKHPMGRISVPTVVPNLLSLRRKETDLLLLAVTVFCEISGVSEE